MIAYRYAAREHPALLYFYPSVKFSFYGYLANYLGFSGYYNPFTGEAQVNTTVPRFVQPFTTCHEIGHQLGYAKEKEANFCGFLATKSSPDPAFRYSCIWIFICILRVPCMRWIQLRLFLSGSR